jgi:Uma2 family endonuclease
VRIDFETDPPPDLVIEIDVRHDSLNKFGIYASLGAPEIWRYDERQLTIYLLEGNQYSESETSRALPPLTAAVLSDFTRRLREEGETRALTAFDEWLRAGRL